MTDANRREHRAQVLVVDDDPNNRALLELMLAHEGYETVMARDGLEALALIARDLPDLILLDVMMPGLDGYQVAARIKADPRTQHVPVVMLSALGDLNSTLHGLNAGAEDYITKPINRAHLIARVRHFLRREEGES